MKNPIPATITQVKTMARAVRISIDSQELLTPDQTGELFSLYDKVGYFFFFPDDKTMLVDTSKLPALKVDEGERSPARRLRNVLFVDWDKNIRGRENDPYAVDFDLYYKHEIDKVIDQVKAKRLA